MNLNFVFFATFFSCLLLPFLKARKALFLISLASMFGTYAINNSMFGVNLLPGPIVSLFYCFWLLLGRFVLGSTVFLRGKVKSRSFIFLIYALSVTAVSPFIFGGEIFVIGSYTVDDSLRGAVPLTFAASNFAQGLYLGLAMLLFLHAAKIAQNPSLNISKVVDFFTGVAFFLSCLVVAETMLGLLNLPADFFSYALGPDLFTPRPDRYALSDFFGFPIRRAQAIFGEPSYYSTFMTGAYGAVLVLQRLRPTVLSFSRVMLIGLGLLLSFSTTAILGLFAISLLVYFIPVEGKQVFKFTMKKLIFLLMFVVFIMFFLSFDGVFDYFFGKLSNVDGYEDGNYSSGAERFFWDLIAGRAFLDSFGLGIGLGSTRASSFILNTLASLGIIGFLFFLSIFFVIFKSLFMNSKFPEDAYLRAAIAMWVGWVLALSISVPDGVSFFYIWILAGFIYSFRKRSI